MAYNLVQEVLRVLHICFVLGWLICFFKFLEFDAGRDLGYKLFLFSDRLLLLLGNR